MLWQRWNKILIHVPQFIMSKERPLGISAIAVFSFLGALLSALSITIEFSEGYAAGFWNILRMSINGFNGFGLWYLKKWVIPWCLIGYTFLLFGNAVMFLSFGVGSPNNIFTSVLIFGIMIYYIYTKRELFTE